MLASDVPVKTKEETSNSIDENIKQKTLTTDHRENSTDDVKSFVIVNDINVEEEISKAQKGDQNFFQVLSMSFYGRMRSHSFDNQESRESQKTAATPQSEAKSALTRKRSAQTPSESKLSASKEMKPKTPGLTKKQALATKELELIPEKSQKRILSPKVDIGKMYSPVVAGKKALAGNFTAKAAGKSGFVFDTPQQQVQRPQTGKKGVEDGNRIGITSDMIMSSSGRSTPMRVELPKKISVSKLAKNIKKVPAVENIEEEKIVTISVDASVLDIQEFQDNADDRDGISCQDSTSKDGKTVKKTTSRRGSDKNLKDKAVVTNNFVKGSATKSQPKINLKDGQDIQEFLLEQKKSSTPLGVSSSNKEIKRGISGKKTIKKKANSQETNMDFSQDKLKKIVLEDFPDVGDEDEKSKTTKSDASKTSKKKSGVKLDRQRSPDVGKLYERIPTILNNGIGDWGMKAALITKYDLTRKGGQQQPQKDGKEKEKEGAFFELPGKKGDAPPPVSRELSKSKKSSMEKLGKGEKLPTQPNQGQGKETKKNEAGSPGKELNARKLDVTRASPKDEKSVKITEMYAKPKEKKEKGRTASPMSGEGRKQGDILDKLLVQKKKEKI